MQSADRVLDDNYLQIRAKLLEIAASLDRIDRSADASSPLSDQALPQRRQLDEAIRICLSEGPDRAERLQKLFSRQYDSDWRKRWQL